MGHTILTFGSQALRWLGKPVRSTIVFVIAYWTLTVMLFVIERNQPNSAITTFADAVWFSIVTITTVGYGDIVPVTQAGRAIAILFALISFGAISFFVSRIYQTLTMIEKNRIYGYNGTNFTDHVVIVGWDEFARSVVERLHKAKQKVAIITDQPEHTEEITSKYEASHVYVLYTQLDDYAKIELARPKEAKVIFINVNSDTDKLIYWLDFKAHFGNLDAVTTLDNQKLENTFKTAGINYVFSKEAIASKVLARYVIVSDVAQFSLDLLGSDIQHNDDDFDIKEYLVNPDCAIIGMQYLEAFTTLKSELNSVLIGITKIDEQGQRQIYKNPSKPITIESSDYVVLIVSKKDSQRVRRFFAQTEEESRSQSV